MLRSRNGAKHTASPNLPEDSGQSNVHNDESLARWQGCRLLSEVTGVQILPGAPSTEGGSDRRAHPISGLLAGLSPARCTNSGSLAQRLEWLPFKQLDQSSNLWRPMLSLSWATEDGLLAQLAEQPPLKRQCVGTAISFGDAMRTQKRATSPTQPTKTNAGVAQLAEQLSCKQSVIGTATRKQATTPITSSNPADVM